MLYLQDKFEVYLFSANPRNKNKVVTIGSLITQDKTYVVGGNMLGDEYCAVLITGPTKIVDEKLPRPYKDIQTIKDALGHVIAWPRFYVSTLSYVQALHSLVSFDACLLNYLFINFVHCRSKGRNQAQTRQLITWYVTFF